MADPDHLTPGPWHPLTVSGDAKTRTQAWTHPDGCPPRCRLGRILTAHQAGEFPALAAELPAGRYQLRATPRGVDVQDANGTDVPGQRPTPPAPVELTNEQLEALGDTADEALSAYHHKDQCDCDQWPTSCASGYTPATWETGAWYPALPAVLAAWELLRPVVLASTSEDALLRLQVERMRDLERVLRHRKTPIEGPVMADVIARWLAVSPEDEQPEMPGA